MRGIIRYIQVSILNINCNAGRITEIKSRGQLLDHSIGINCKNAIVTLICNEQNAIVIYGQIIRKLNIAVGRNDKLLVSIYRIDCPNFSIIYVCDEHLLVVLFTI